LKAFDIPNYYHSPFISRIKELRNQADKLKKDFSPSVLEFGNFKFKIARHFGFCYGVQNAIEIAYKTIADHPNKRIYLISEMIHNPEVNADLQAKGLNFIQDTAGNQLISWNELKSDDIVIIPAFGTSLENLEKLNAIGLELEQYDTTCPFVVKVWNRSASFSKDNVTTIIHGDFHHEETRATFSRAKSNGKALVIADLNEAKLLGDMILNSSQKHLQKFAEKASENFDFLRDLNLIAVVNQTTMLASETIAIAEYLKGIMVQKHGLDELDSHFKSSRDTLCYATNDNQSATNELLAQEADIAFVIGGYNSSNTSHLAELLSEKHPTFYIENETSIESESQIRHFDLNRKAEVHSSNYLNFEKLNTILISSGASCPDSTVERVIQKILSFTNEKPDIYKALERLEQNLMNGL
jgi:4-hydroxy-3-methylbut-2-enyl diphosphate reductase